MEVSLQRPVMPDMAQLSTAELAHLSMVSLVLGVALLLGTPANVYALVRVIKMSGPLGKHLLLVNNLLVGVVVCGLVIPLDLSWVSLCGLHYNSTHDLPAIKVLLSTHQAIFNLCETAFYVFSTVIAIHRLNIICNSQVSTGNNMMQLQVIGTVLAWILGVVSLLAFLVTWYLFHDGRVVFGTITVYFICLAVMTLCYIMIIHFVYKSEKHKLSQYQYRVNYKRFHEMTRVLGGSFNNVRKSLRQSRVFSRSMDVQNTADSLGAGPSQRQSVGEEVLVSALMGAALEPLNLIGVPRKSVSSRSLSRRRSSLDVSQVMRVRQVPSPILEQDLTLPGCVLGYDLTLPGCVLEQDLTLPGCVLKQDLTLPGCVLEQDLTLPRSGLDEQMLFQDPAPMMQVGEFRSSLGSDRTSWQKNERPQLESMLMVPNRHLSNVSTAFSLISEASSSSTMTVMSTRSESRLVHSSFDPMYLHRSSLASDIYGLPSSSRSLPIYFLKDTDSVSVGEYEDYIEHILSCSEQKRNELKSLFCSEGQGLKKKKTKRRRTKHNYSKNIVSRNNVEQESQKKRMKKKTKRCVNGKMHDLKAISLPPLQTEKVLEKRLGEKERPGSGPSIPADYSHADNSVPADANTYDLHLASQSSGLTSGVDITRGCSTDTGTAAKTLGVPTLNSGACLEDQQVRNKQKSEFKNKTIDEANASRRVSCKKLSRIHPMPTSVPTPLQADLAPKQRLSVDCSITNDSSIPTTPVTPILFKEQVHFPRFRSKFKVTLRRAVLVLCHMLLLMPYAVRRLWQPLQQHCDCTMALNTIPVLGAFACLAFTLFPFLYVFYNKTLMKPKI